MGGRLHPTGAVRPPGRLARGARGHARGDARPARARPWRRGSPDPVPNSEVKPAVAESTAPRGCGRVGCRARAGRMPCARGPGRKAGALFLCPGPSGPPCRMAGSGSRPSSLARGRPRTRPPVAGRSAHAAHAGPFGIRLLKKGRVAAASPMRPPGSADACVGGSRAPSRIQGRFAPSARIAGPRPGRTASRMRACMRYRGYYLSLYVCEESLIFSALVICCIVIKLPVCMVVLPHRDRDGCSHHGMGNDTL